MIGVSDDYRCESTTTTGARCKNHALNGYRACHLHADAVERATAIVFDAQQAIEAEAELRGWPFWRLREFLQ